MWSAGMKELETQPWQFLLPTNSQLYVSSMRYSPVFSLTLIVLHILANMWQQKLVNTSDNEQRKHVIINI
jgi:hypothetical protein